MKDEEGTSKEKEQKRALVNKEMNGSERVEKWTVLRSRGPKVDCVHYVTSGDTNNITTSTNHVMLSLKVKQMLHRWNYYNDPLVHQRKNYTIFLL